MIFTKKTAIPILFLLLLAAGFFFLRKPIQYRLGPWSVNRNLASLETAIEANEWTAAKRFATAAHQLDPHRPEPVLALLRLAREGRQGMVADAAVRVLRHPETSTSEKANALGVFLEKGDGVVFQRLFRQLPESIQRETVMLRLYGRYLAQSGKIRDAAGILEGLLKKHPAGSPEIPLELASILTRVALSNPGAGQRAQELILALLRNPSERDHALRGLRLLQAIPPDQWQCGPLLGAARWIDSFPGTQTTDHLQLAALRIRKDEASRAEEVNRAISRFAKEEPALLGRWLSALGEHSRALEVLDATTARSTSEWFIARARILHLSERFEEAADWLKDPHPGVRLTMIANLRAVIAVSDQNVSRDKVNELWKKALRQAELENSTDAFWLISRSAAISGNKEVEMKAAVAALKKSGPHPSEDKLGPVIEWLYRNDRGDDLRSVFRTLIRRQPDSPMMRNNLAYLEIVTGNTSESVAASLEVLCQNFPDVPEFMTSLAVACLARGEYQKSRTLLESAIKDWESAPTPVLAAYAVALKAGQDKSGRSEQVLARIAWDELLTEEREFFQSRLQSVAVFNHRLGLSTSL